MIRIFHGGLYTSEKLINNDSGVRECNDLDCDGKVERVPKTSKACCFDNAALFRPSQRLLPRNTSKILCPKVIGSIRARQYDHLAVASLYIPPRQL